MTPRGQSTWAEAIDRAIDAGFDRMIEVRRHLHVHPEPSGSEKETTRYVRERLDAAGFAVRNGPEGRGLIVDSLEESGGPRIGLRADLDALPFQDAKTVEYRSREPRVMHACGHDAHTATVLGAILALDEARRSGELPWPVPWRAIFQPAEETAAGALEMVEAGALESVKAILGLHVDPSRPVGAVGIRDGIFTADCVEMEFKIKGEGSHAARPHESLDPIATAAQLINSLYLSIPRSVDSQEPVVVTIGQIMSGETPNSIPDRAVLKGTLRTLSAEVRQRTLDRIEQLTRGLAEASGTQIEMNCRFGPPALTNDPDLTELLRRTATELLGSEAVQSIRHPSMGGEDFANYLAHVPGSMFRLGCASTASGAPPLHSPHFDVDEGCMKIGAKVLARAAVHWSNPTSGDGRGL